MSWNHLGSTTRWSAVWPIMNRSLGPGLLRRERSPGVHPHEMPGWITDKPDGSRAVWEVEGESGNECSTQFFRLLAALLNVQHLNIDHAVEGTDLPLRNSNRSDGRSTRNPAVTNQHQPTERNGGGFVGSSAEFAGPLVALLGVVVGGA